MVNSRPLVYIDDDINSSMIITPTDFLSFRRHHVFPNVGGDNPDPEFEIAKRATSSYSLLETWKRGQNYLNQIWSIWRNEYLLNLREKSQTRAPIKGSKNVPTPKIGNVVLIKESLPRGHWRVGRIIEVIKGRDQKIRSAKVMVAPNKYLNRAVSMLYPIECSDNDEVASESDVATMGNKIIDTKLSSDGETDQNMTLDDEESDEISEDLCRSHSTRKAAIAAKNRLKVWLDPDDDVLLGSVVDHTRV